ncbi:hypothetical protein HCMG_01566 [Helicobacter canadensis MIT 98-5491]|nr:hypothetical protein HCMG_01566 [Helicobacter canadensis MIT 98-5491]
MRFQRELFTKQVDKLLNNNNFLLRIIIYNSISFFGSKSV